MPQAIQVEGLRDLQRALKATGDVTGQREFRQAGKKVSEQIVIPGARSAAGGVSHHRTGRSSMFVRAAETLKSTTVAAGAAVRYGRGLPYAMGAEFGSNRFPQFNAHQGRTGYFFWPTVRAKTDEIVDAYGDAVDQVWNRG